MRAVSGEQALLELLQVALQVALQALALKQAPLPVQLQPACCCLLQQLAVHPSPCQTGRQ